MLDYGADPNFKDLLDRAPVYWAAKNGYGGVAETLKRQGAECNSQLRLAVLRKQVPVIKTLLKMADVDPNWEDKRGLSSVCWAAISGDRDVMEAPLESGKADTEFKATPLRVTPLGLAASYGENDVIGPLLTKSQGRPGANVNWVDEMDSTPLMLAAVRGHTDVVKGILESGEANIGHENLLKRTALLDTAMAGNEVVFRLLLKPEKNLNRPDAFGRSTIFHAIRGGSRQIIDALLSVPELDIWTPDFYGSTCLSIAARFGDNSTIMTLLSRGNNNPSQLRNIKTDLLCRRGNFGRSPMTWAIRNGHSSTRDYLLDEHKQRKLKHLTGGDESEPLRTPSPNRPAKAQPWPYSFCDVCFFNVGPRESYYTCDLCFGTKNRFVCCLECWDFLRPRPTCRNSRHKLYLRTRKEEE